MNASDANLWYFKYHVITSSNFSQVGHLTDRPVRPVRPVTVSRQVQSGGGASDTHQIVGQDSLEPLAITWRLERFCYRQRYTTIIEGCLTSGYRILDDFSICLMMFDDVWNIFEHMFFLNIFQRDKTHRK